MLVLSRKLGEELVIRKGGEIVARVIIHQVGENKVKLATLADSDVEVNRGEVDLLRHPQADSSEAA